jgi:rubrerythrin
MNNSGGVMEKYSAREVIEQAIQTEKLGAQFYAEMAERFTEEAEIKKLFETLSAKEVAHEKIFSQLKEKVRDAIEGEEEFSHYLRAVVESAFFLGKDKSLTTMANVQSLSDAVNHALGFEKESLLYYLGLKEIINEKDVIEDIIREEKSHIAWLSKFRAGLDR